MQPDFPFLEMVDLLAEARSSSAPYRNIVVNQVNDHCLRLATFEGEYPWHVHPDSDELFMVMDGALEIDLADGRTLRLAPWQMVTVPAGAVHRTRAIGRAVNITFECLAASTTFIDAVELPRPLPRDG